HDFLFACKAAHPHGPAAAAHAAEAATAHWRAAAAHWSAAAGTTTSAHPHPVAAHAALHRVVCRRFGQRYAADDVEGTVGGDIAKLPLGGDDVDRMSVRPFRHVGDELLAALR